MLLLLPSGSLNEDSTPLAITGFRMKSSFTTHITSSLYQSLGSWVPTSSWTETRDKETNIHISYSITTQYSHVLDAYNRCGVSPQPASREDYSLVGGIPPGRVTPGYKGQVSRSTARSKQSADRVTSRQAESRCDPTYGAYP